MDAKKILHIAIISIFAVGAIFGVFELFRLSGAFTLRAVQISGNHFVTKEEIVKLVDFDFSRDLFEIDTDKIEKSLLKHPLIQSVQVTKSFPAILDIKIKEHQFIGGIAGSEIAIASETQDVIEEYPAEVLYDLPVITGIHFETDEYGNRVPEDPEKLNYCIAIIKAIRDKDPVLYTDLSELHYDEQSGITLYLRKRNLPVIIGKGHIAQKLNAFATFYHRKLRKQNWRKIAFIDARFQSQVILKLKT